MKEKIDTTNTVLGSVDAQNEKYNEEIGKVYISGIVPENAPIREKQEALSNAHKAFIKKQEDVAKEIIKKWNDTYPNNKWNFHRPWTTHIGVSSENKMGFASGDTNVIFEKLNGKWELTKYDVDIPKIGPEIDKLLGEASKRLKGFTEEIFLQALN